MGINEHHIGRLLYCCTKLTRMVLNVLKQCHPGIYAAITQLSNAFLMSAQVITSENRLIFKSRLYTIGFN